MTSSKLKIGPYELPSRFVLAPMAGVTDKPFRALCRHFGAGIQHEQQSYRQYKLANSEYWQKF